jgi:D-alanine-D-alanine ligase
MNIVVLAGGLSPERDVSLSSASLIANALMEKGHGVLLLDVYEGYQKKMLNLEDLFLTLKDGIKYQYTVSNEEPDLDAIKQKNNNQTTLIGPNVLEICRFADVVFMGLHGSIGENGGLQATFDNFDIKYTGTGYIGSLLAMDKDLSKRLFVQGNIPTADWIYYNMKEDNIYHIIDSIGFPCVVKPCSCGSSIGVSIVKDMDELNNALVYASKYETSVLIEKMINGREFSVGVLNNETLPVIEIIPKEGFYDYKNKYQSGLTKEVCPADLTDELTHKVQLAALKVHKTLRLGSYSRIDFILDSTGEFVCLEANTLPGMTPTSLIPQEAQSLGIEYNDLCEKIALLSFNTNK